MNIYEHKILQGFQGTHVAERTCTLQGPFIENCSERKLIITLLTRLPYIQTGTRACPIVA